MPIRVRVLKLVSFGVLLIFMGWVPALGQSYSLSGKITDTTTHVVPSATVFAKSIASGKTYTALSDAGGSYTIPDLPAGDYKVWAKAGELRAAPVKVTLAAAETTDLVVSPVHK